MPSFLEKNYLRSLLCLLLLAVSPLQASGLSSCFSSLSRIGKNILDNGIIGEAARVTWVHGKKVYQKLDDAGKLDPVKSRLIDPIVDPLQKFANEVWDLSSPVTQHPLRKRFVDPVIDHGVVPVARYVGKYLLLPAVTHPFATFSKAFWYPFWAPYQAVRNGVVLRTREGASWRSLPWKIPARIIKEDGVWAALYLAMRTLAKGSVLTTQELENQVQSSHSDAFPDDLDDDDDGITVEVNGFAQVGNDLPFHDFFRTYFFLKHGGLVPSFKDLANHIPHLYDILAKQVGFNVDTAKWDKVTAKNLGPEKIHGSNPKKIYIHVNDFGDLVSELENISAKLGPIRRLNFYGHGFPGGFKLNQQMLSRDLLDSQNQVQRKKGIFSPGANIVFFACDVGRGEQGTEFMKDIGEYFLDKGGMVHGSRVIFAGSSSLVAKILETPFLAYLGHTDLQKRVKNHEEYKDTPFMWGEKRINSVKIDPAP